MSQPTGRPMNWLYYNTAIINEDMGGVYYMPQYPPMQYYMGQYYSQQVWGPYYHPQCPPLHNYMGQYYISQCPPFYNWMGQDSTTLCLPMNTVMGPHCHIRQIISAPPTPGSSTRPTSTSRKRKNEDHEGRAANIKKRKRSAASSDLKKYIETLCENEQFVSQVEDIISDKFLDFVLSDDPNVDLKQLEEELLVEEEAMGRLRTATEQ